ncbi:hypothetical protein D3C75_1037110 [compost metagenome]
MPKCNLGALHIHLHASDGSREYRSKAVFPGFSHYYSYGSIGTGDYSGEWPHVASPGPVYLLYPTCAANNRHLPDASIHPIDPPHPAGPHNIQTGGLPVS